MTVSFEAVPHSPSCGVAQPQSSMKESHPAKVHLQEVDQTATASSTSNKSTSLQLLLLLHMTAGIAAHCAPPKWRQRHSSSTLQDAAAVKTGTCRDVMAVYPTRCWPRAAAGTSVGGCPEIMSKLTTAPFTHTAVCTRESR